MRNMTFNIKNWSRLLIIYEISLVGNKMFTFINYRLCVIKQVHTKFVGGFDIIMTSDFLSSSSSKKLLTFKTKFELHHIISKVLISLINV